MERKILYAFDPVSCNTFYARLLTERMNVQVDFVNNRSEVNKMLDRGHYDGVYMDTLRLAPGEDFSSEGDYCENGLAVVRDVKKRGLPLVVLSGAPKEILDEALELGADFVAQKPERSEVIFSNVSRVFCIPLVA